jgi:hypothetical protein
LAAERISGPSPDENWRFSWSARSDRKLENGEAGRCRGKILNIATVSRMQGIEIIGIPMSPSLLRLAVCGRLMMTVLTSITSSGDSRAVVGDWGV